ncbi:MAG: AAA family ATPase [Bacteroidales bacterium]|nr:AAA family ATPase [Bacteroidales bacterium]
MKKTYFGIPLNCENELDAFNLAARLFLCPRISAQHVAAYLNMLSNNGISIEKMLKKTNHVIPDFRASLGNGEDVSSIINNKLKEWTNIFAAPDKEDFEFLETNFGISEKHLFTNNTKVPRTLRPKDINSPRLMADYVKQYIKGQDDVIEKLAVTFYHHLDSLNKGYTSYIKSPAILIGPTGCGKSEMLRHFSNACRCPIIRINTSEITPTGWRGLNLTDILRKEIEIYDDPNKLKYAILVFHEFDKITHYGTRVNKSDGNASDLDMIRDIMRLFEKDHPLTIETGKSFSTTCCELPTDNFLIIFDGAFYGIEEIVKKRLNINKTIGFSSKANDNNINYQKMVTEEDLIEWGYPPELLGRIGEVLALNPLSSETIFEIMKTAKDNILNYHIEYCSNNNIDLSFSDDALQYVADKAYSSGLGFRNVKTILSKALNNLYYELSENQTSNNRRSIEIDKEYFKKSIG